MENQMISRMNNNLNNNNVENPNIDKELYEACLYADYEKAKEIIDSKQKIYWVYQNLEHQGFGYLHALAFICGNDEPEIRENKLKIWHLIKKKFNCNYFINLKDNSGFSEIKINLDFELNDSESDFNKFNKYLTISGNNSNRSKDILNSEKRNYLEIISQYLLDNNIKVTSSNVIKARFHNNNFGHNKLIESSIKFEDDEISYFHININKKEGATALEIAIEQGFKEFAYEIINSRKDLELASSLKTAYVLKEYEVSKRLADYFIENSDIKNTSNFSEFNEIYEKYGISIFDLFYFFNDKHPEYHTKNSEEKRQKFFDLYEKYYVNSLVCLYIKKLNSGELKKENIFGFRGIYTLNEFINLFIYEHKISSSRYNSSMLLISESIIFPSNKILFGGDLRSNIFSVYLGLSKDIIFVGTKLESAHYSHLIENKDIINIEDPAPEIITLFKKFDPGYLFNKLHEIKRVKNFEHYEELIKNPFTNACLNNNAQDYEEENKDFTKLLRLIFFPKFEQEYYNHLLILYFKELKRSNYHQDNGKIKTFLDFVNDFNRFNNLPLSREVTINLDDNKFSNSVFIGGNLENIEFILKPSEVSYYSDAYNKKPEFLGVEGIGKNDKIQLKKSGIKIFGKNYFNKNNLHKFWHEKNELHFHKLFYEANPSLYKKFLKKIHVQNIRTELGKEKYIYFADAVLIMNVKIIFRISLPIIGFLNIDYIKARVKQSIIEKAQYCFTLLAKFALAGVLTTFGVAITFCIMQGENKISDFFLNIYSNLSGKYRSKSLIAEYAENREKDYVPEFAELTQLLNNKKNIVINVKELPQEAYNNSGINLHSDQMGLSNVVEQNNISQDVINISHNL